MRKHEMSILEKIITKSKATERPLGQADREAIRVRTELANQKQLREDRARLAALETKLATDDIEHFAAQREAFIRREKPSESALVVFNANQKVELLQRVIARTKPQPIQLNDGSLGTHPTVGKLLAAKAALTHAIATHERMQNLRPEMFSSVNAAQGNAGEYLKGKG
jgi:hypothetical protein